jgi:hypothetical protein
MEDFLCALMAKTLKDKVISDFDEVPKEHQGAISLFHCMVNCMVLKNEESHCNLQKWIQDFTISNFPGENVTKACLCIKAVANAIGHDKLPSDIITQILNGIWSASTKEFCNICNTQTAMMTHSNLKQMVKKGFLYTSNLSLFFLISKIST